jgi:hypothetical protein
MKKYKVYCYYDNGDSLENYCLEFLAYSKVEAIEAMKQSYPNADGYKAELCY